MSANHGCTNGPTAADQGAERELQIRIHVDSFADFEGTAAQLIAEGFIPKRLEWPDGAAEQYWEANGMSYRLGRRRPQGHKGPMRSWLCLDNWFVRVEVIGRNYNWIERRALERKAEEIQAAYHRMSAAGSREAAIAWKRYCAARNDDAFQAFKGLVIPQRKKPGRPAKTRAGGGAL